ncbi:v-type ATPase D subunit [Clostridium sp. CAG:413]|jgi:V/A-type H+-transporting ATPase subunit D|nr:v-type ATPase D subunit [Clostridium sp. CAG:413]
MAARVSPTKGNLMKIKKSLELAKVGYDLLDRKRNILIRETMGLIDSAADIRSRIAESYRVAYQALEEANMSMGIVDEFAAFVPVENGLTISSRSVMGVEIPTVSLDPVPTDNYFGFRRTTAKLDEAYRRFNEVKQLTAELAQTENSVYRLATGIKKAQKRANALKNIIIPRFEEQVKTITAALDEKDREEFSRLKVIKSFIDED